MNYYPKATRYNEMKYNRCGKSGILLPAISVGLWHNFGSVDIFEIGRSVLRHAFDNGVTYFDLANNYGYPFGSAEENLGRILKKDFSGYLRDELIISTKAGFGMWEGPYGSLGSRKHLIASLDQSLQRLQLDYVDIFYSHRSDPDTPFEETMAALDTIVKQGKALYVGLSNYSAEETQTAIKILNNLGTRCLIHQPEYSLFERNIEKGLLNVLEDNYIGCSVFSPLAQGLLTDRYLNGIPSNSRAASPYGFLTVEEVTELRIRKIRKLKDFAAGRNQSLAQMALSWILKDNRITTVVVGIRTVEQLSENLETLKNGEFSESELSFIDEILKSD